ncbi:MAG: group 1 truncated hemoglobin [Chitinophagaceae bacterium]
MKKITHLFIACFLLCSCFQKANAQESLYKRLGGYDAIAAVTDDFIGRLAGNKDLGRFFAGASDDSKKKIRQHIVDFLCNAAGGPCAYIGRSMKESHQGLKISEKDWNTTAGLLVETLNKFKVPQKEQGELLSLVSSVKKDIVEM